MSTVPTEDWVQVEPHCTTWPKMLAPHGVLIDCIQRTVLVNGAPTRVRVAVVISHKGARLCMCYFAGTIDNCYVDMSTLRLFPDSDERGKASLAECAKIYQLSDDAFAKHEHVYEVVAGAPLE